MKFEMNNQNMKGMMMKMRDERTKTMIKRGLGNKAKDIEADENLKRKIDKEIAEKKIK